MVEFTKFLGQLGRSWWLGTLINAALVAAAIFLFDLPPWQALILGFGSGMLISKIFNIQWSSRSRR